MSPFVQFVKISLTNEESFNRIATSASDVVHHLGAQQDLPLTTKAQGVELYWSAIYVSTKNILRFMCERRLRKLVYFGTDYVYGHSQSTPRAENHPRCPLGDYGRAAYRAEELCGSYRERGMFITIFRPCLLFQMKSFTLLSQVYSWIDRSMPIPVFGSGRSTYQFLSLRDCASAALCAIDAKMPNENYNLGSHSPLPLEDHLQLLIRQARSRSTLFRVPVRIMRLLLSSLDKVRKPLMLPEFYLEAGQAQISDCSKARRELGWLAKDQDKDILVDEYLEYRIRTINSLYRPRY